MLLGIRPNALTLSDASAERGGLAGTVTLVEHVGAASVIAVKLSDGATAHDEEGAVPGEIMVTVQGYSDLKPGAAVSVELDLSEAVLFSRSTSRRLETSAASATSAV